MADSSSRVFGLFVAYVVPGFIGLTGLIPIFPIVGQWIAPVNQGDLGFGPPIYALLGAVAVGLIVSCFRWLLLDQFHHFTGVRRPALNHQKLAAVLPSFDYLVQNHFRYYEFAGNTLLAALWAYGVSRLTNHVPHLGPGTDLGMVILSIVLFTAGRDALLKYYTRSDQLAGQSAEKEQEGDSMFNGNHNQQESGATPEKKPTPNKAEKPVATTVTPPAKETDPNEPKPKK